MSSPGAAVAAVRLGIWLAACTSSACVPSPGAPAIPADDTIHETPPPRIDGVVVSGTVRDSSGQPVPDAVVAVFPLAPLIFEAQPRAHVRSDAWGRFSLTLTAGEKYSLTATAAGRAPAYLLSSAFEKRGDRMHVTITMAAEPTRKVRGRLLMHDGRPAATGMVRIFPALPARKQQEIYLAIPDAAGEFRTSLRKGEYMVIGDAPDATFSVERLTLDDRDLVAEVRLRPPPRQLTDAATQDLRSAAVPIDIASLDGAGAQGARLQASLCDSRVVGIGESTHGSSEFTRLKGHIMLRLAAECGFNAFLIEADMSVAAQIDDFVLTGKGDPARLLNELGSWPYAHEEFLALLQAIRAHNARSQVPVHVLGVDPWNSELPAAKLLEYFKAQRGLVSARMAAGLEAMRGKDFQAWSAGIPEGERKTMRAALDEIEAFLQRQSTSSGRKAAWRRASLHLRALRSIERESAGSDRDRNMTDNLRWLLEVYVPGAKAVLSAHNGHVLLARAVWKSPAMGDLLVDWLGDRYISVGVLFGRGSFRAFALENGKPTKLANFSLGNPAPTSLEAVLDRLGHRAFFLDLRSLTGPGRSWLESELPSREVGSMYSSEAMAAQHVAPVLTFHAIAYIAELTAIKPLPR